MRTHRNFFKDELPGFSRLLGARLSAWASVIVVFTSLDLISSMAMMQPRMQAEGIGRSRLEKPRLFAVPASSMLSIVSRDAAVSLTLVADLGRIVSEDFVEFIDRSACNLTLQERIRSCTSPEHFTEIAQSYGLTLSTEELFKNSRHLLACYFPWHGRGDAWRIEFFNPPCRTAPCERQHRMAGPARPLASPSKQAEPDRRLSRRHATG
ncbi:hypothetical protein SynWH8101_1299 [Synechococcus sp. WH 8101]|nr:hypothetical protein SynWH8101_1299 [Synechococcus sp. WH 8101]